MSVTVTGVTPKRSQWPELENIHGLADLAYVTPVQPGMSMTHKTGLSPVASYKFTGLDYTGSDRYPQGVAAVGDFVLTSFYFKYAPLQSACKLVAFSRSQLLATNVGILTFSNGLFRRINTHGGGIEIIGNYLYVEDSSNWQVRVFDLREIYPVADNAAVCDMADPFISGQITYFMPEVGTIQFSSTVGGQLAYLSKIGSGSSATHLVSGNFWIAGSNTYGSGGKTMVWKWPLDHTLFEFPVPIGTAQQFEPKNPSGADVGLSVDKVQGALLLSDGNLILNKSYGAGTYHLMVLNLNYPQAFFAGDTTNPVGFNWKNWLYGCEDISLCDDGTIVTVTEFGGDRDVTFWNLAQVVGLTGVVLFPTIAEHEAALDQLHQQIASLEDEADFYALQIQSAISQNLERFDRHTFTP